MDQKNIRTIRAVNCPNSSDYGEILKEFPMELFSRFLISSNGHRSDIYSFTKTLIEDKRGEVLNDHKNF